MRSLIRLLIGTLAVLTTVLLRATATEPPASGSDFSSEMNASMMNMHAAMNIRATGDVDTDSVALMIPHHQGAIDMARTQLRYGHSERLRRIAQEIIIEQQQEIVAMSRALVKSPNTSESK